MVLSNLIAVTGQRDVFSSAKTGKAVPVLKQKITGVKTFNSTIEGTRIALQLFYNAGECYKVTLLKKENGTKFVYDFSKNSLAVTRKDAQGNGLTRSANFEDTLFFWQTTDKLVEKMKPVVENGVFLGPIAESCSKSINIPIKTENHLKTKIAMPTHPSYKNISGERDLEGYANGKSAKVKIIFKNGKVDKVCSEDEDYKFTYYPMNGHLVRGFCNKAFKPCPTTVLDVISFREHIIIVGAKLKDTKGEEAMVNAVILSCVFRQTNELMTQN